jgi:magnesium chelatase subunit I
MHFGLIPRTNRGIFCMNELPDLSPKIQVGLFNVLEERDIQIRGYPIRLNLDLCLVFSANPEDYTNRGRIVTPLKDRIGSVIRTHYPLTRDQGIQIADANAWMSRNGVQVLVPHFMKEVLEEFARLARSSPAINQQSGVSVRMSIANLENAISNAERRGIVLGESPVVPRVTDLIYLAASTRGKIELTMTEDEGQEDRVIDKLLGEAIKNIFEIHCEVKQLRPIVEAFESGQTFLAGERLLAAEYVHRLQEFPALKKEVSQFLKKIAAEKLPSEAHDALTASAAEFILEGLHVENRLNRNMKQGNVVFKR